MPSARANWHSSCSPENSPPNYKVLTHVAHTVTAIRSLIVYLIAFKAFSRLGIKKSDVFLSWEEVVQVKRVGLFWKYIYLKSSNSEVSFPELALNRDEVKVFFSENLNSEGLFSEFISGFYSTRRHRK